MTNREVRKISFAVMSIFVAFFVLFSLSCNAFASTTGTTKFSVDIENTVLELTVPATPAVIDLNPTMTGASFGSTSINVKVATNNITGYQLTMTPTNSQTNTSLIRTELVGSESTYREIETLEQTDPVSTGYPEADFTANRWGYKITGDNYYGIDPNNTTISHPAWVTNEPTNGTNHNLTLAAKVDANTVSGAYETTLNFRAVTNAVVAKDTVTFNGNGADNADAMANVVLQAPSGESTTLPANLYTRDGYSFVGWSTIPSGSGGLVYNDQVSYRNNSPYNRNIILYAQWTPVGTPTPSGGERGTGDGGGVGTGTTLQQAYEIAYTAMHKGMYEEIDTEENAGKFQYIDSWNGANYQGEGRDVRFLIQDMTPEICASATDIGSTAIVLDIRDQTSYRIIKAADNRCWMQDNLALNLLDSNVRTTMINNPSYTNANADSLTSLFFGNRINGNEYAITGVSDWTSSNSYSAPLINTSNKNILPTTYEGIDEPLASIVESESWKVGIYYNYCAASAGSFCYGNGTSYGSPVDRPNTLIDAEYDICPFGWRMPTGAVTGEYYVLAYAISGITGSGTVGIYSGEPAYSFRKTLHVPLLGEFNYGTASRQGYRGRIWSSTYYNRGDVHILFVEKSSFSTIGVSNWYYGGAVRCIAK